MVAIAVEKPLVLSLRDDPGAAFDLIEIYPEQTLKEQRVFGQ
jgi:hypothetical protein